MKMLLLPDDIILNISCQTPLENSSTKVVTQNISQIVGKNQMDRVDQKYGNKENVTQKKNFIAIWNIHNIHVH